MKIPIPDTFRLGPYDMTVKMCPEDEMNDKGTFRSFYKLIRIDETAAPDLKQEVFIHEIIEAVNGYYGLELEHHKITVLGMALTQVLRDLPEEVSA